MQRHGSTIYMLQKKQPSDFCPFHANDLWQNPTSWELFRRYSRIFQILQRVKAFSSPRCLLPFSQDSNAKIENFLETAIIVD